MHLRDLLPHSPGGFLRSLLLFFDELIGRHHSLPKLLSPRPQRQAIKWVAGFCCLLLLLPAGVVVLAVTHRNVQVCADVEVQCLRWQKHTIVRRWILESARCTLS